MNHSVWIHRLIKAAAASVQWLLETFRFWPTLFWSRLSVAPFTSNFKLPHYVLCQHVPCLQRCRFSLLDEASTHGVSWSPSVKCRTSPLGPARCIPSPSTSVRCSRPSSFLCRLQDAGFADSWRRRQHRRQIVCPVEGIFMKVTPVNICTRQLLTEKKENKKAA